MTATLPLFDSAPAAWATVSPCGAYRYLLGRRWGSGPCMLYVMLNPSTADAYKPDPTITRCIGFAKAHGVDAFEVVNLYAFRSPSPAVLRRRIRSGEDAIGPENEDAIRAARDRAVAAGGMIVAAWGAPANRAVAARAADVLRELRARADVHRFEIAGQSRPGDPEDYPPHPLMLPSKTTVARWHLGWHQGL